MANLSISGIRERIFNNTKHEQTVARSSNPFAQTSLKGNVLTADVFESSKQENQSSASIPAKSKLYLSAMVGSINNFGSRLHEKLNKGVESVVSFCGRISNNVSNTWKEMQNTEIKFDIFDNMRDALRPGIRKNDIAKMELSNEEIYNNVHELFSSKANAWSESMEIA